MAVMFLKLKNISTAQGVLFPSLSVHCIGNTMDRYIEIRGFLSECNYREGFTGKKSRLAYLSRTGIN